jgi:hypothetical protein
LEQVTLPAKTKITTNNRSSGAHARRKYINDERHISHIILQSNILLANTVTKTHTKEGTLQHKSNATFLLAPS